MREESCVEWSEYLESELIQMSSSTLSSDNQLWPLQYLCTLATIHGHEESSDRAFDLDSPSLLTKENQQCMVSYYSYPQIVKYYVRNIRCTACMATMLP